MTDRKLSIKCPLLNSTVKIYITDDLMGKFEFLKHKFKGWKFINQIDLENLYILGMTFDITLGDLLLDNYVILERTNGYLDSDTITHEIFHATVNILNFNKYKFKQSEEAFAHLNGSLNSLVLYKLERLGEKIIHKKELDLSLLPEPLRQTK